MKKLMQHLKQIDGKGYKAYKSVQGHYKFADFDLYIDYVQGDPFASPSKIRVVLPQKKRRLKAEWMDRYHRKVTVEDTLARMIGKAVSKSQHAVKGSGKSGAIFFDTPGQEIIERSAVQIDSSTITVCLSVGLPANGRKINGREAEKLFVQLVPNIMRQSIFTVKDQEMEAAVKLADQQEAIRKEMQKNYWGAFIANGAILPRESGVSNHPMQGAITFQSPPENEVSLSVPHQREPVKGMAIKKGITLIVGGGYHGKSTLLQAIETGVYTHVKGDGREFVLTDPDAVKIRAEDGRQISGVNISPFINNLPHKQDTSFFSTENASGSTSQAANVMEALEAGATTLLIDEDTSATNFMIRDQLMQQLVKKEKEPITPFIEKIEQMRDQHDISTVLVMGGSGDYFAVADEVIMMDEYVPKNVTGQARSIMKKSHNEQSTASATEIGEIRGRFFQQSSLQTQKGKRSKVQAKAMHHIMMGRTTIMFDDTEQLVDASQTRMIAEVIHFLDRTNGLGQKNVKELLDAIERQMDDAGLASFTVFKNQHPGDIARPRRHEIAAVFNRIRTLAVK